jgi:hypothetical protein
MVSCLASSGAFGSRAGASIIAQLYAQVNIATASKDTLVLLLPAGPFLKAWGANAFSIAVPERLPFSLKCGGVLPVVVKAWCSIQVVSGGPGKFETLTARKFLGLPFSRKHPAKWFPRRALFRRSAFISAPCSVLL